MLVIAPIVILVLTGLISAMVAMVGDALSANTRATTAFESQDSLDRIEQDIRTSISFMKTFSYFTSPQGRAGGTEPFTSTSDLILTQQATTTSPYSATRDLVYYADQPAACGPDTSTNNTLKVRTVYFLRNGSLWRRTLVDPWNGNTPSDLDTVCSNPWQRDTCPTTTSPSLIGSGPTYTCNGVDEEMLKNVTAFTTEYYTNGTTTTTEPLLATAVKVTITTTKSVSGETITQTMSTRAQKRNDIATSTANPSNPVISRYNAGIEADDNPVTVSFQWASNDASNYKVSTSSDGGTTWSTPFLTTANTVAVTVPYNGMPARVKVTSYNTFGSSSEVTSSQLISPTWGMPGLLNGWTCFDDAEPIYGCPYYTVSSSGLVIVRGLAKGGTVNQPLFVLPESIRPRGVLTLPASSSSAMGRVDVKTNGEVTIVSGVDTANYVSLDNIRYLSKSAPGVTWTNSTVASWANWAAQNPAYHGNPQWATDSDGRVFAPAVVTGSAGTPGNNCATCDYIQIPATNKPDATMIIPAVSAGNIYNAAVVNSAQVPMAIEANAIGSTTSWNSLNPIFYRNDLDPTWNAMTFSNSWVNSGGIYNAAGCSVRNGVVTLRGRIYNGTATSATIVGTLPVACPLPTKRIIFMAAGVKTSGANADQIPVRVDVESSTRNIRFYHAGTGSNKWLSLEGLMYYAN